MVKIAQLDHAFSEFFELKASSIGGQSLKQKDRRRKRKGEKKSIIKTYSRSLSHPKILISAHARTKML